MIKASYQITAILYCIFFHYTASISAQTLAFPEAVGHGRFVTGGRNGTVYHVTNLNDSGTGSFRDAVSSSNRIVVFDVGGYINLLTAVSIKSNITIAGQTAPGGGIGFRGGKLSCGKQSNIIIRHIRIRPGSEVASNEDDGINLYDAKNVILDHCSIEFSPWNNIGGVSDNWQTYPVTNVTIQSCLIADPTYQQFGAHIESVNSDWTMAYNAFVNSHNRNPLSKINDVFVNNILYNYSAGYTTHTSTNFSHDIVNNYFVMGPASSGTDNTWFQVDKNQSIYYSGNMKDKTLDGVLNGAETTPYWYQGAGTILTAPWSPITSTLPVYSAASAFRFVSSLSGTLPWDQMDSLIWSQVNTLGSGTTGKGVGTRGPDGGLYTSQTETGLPNNGYGIIYGGTKQTDTDNDGMPDFWEKTNSLNINSNEAMTIGSDGYTNIERYLNWLGKLHATVDQNSYIDIDLAKYTGGFAKVSPIYTTSAATNGTAVLQSNGHTVRFTPSSNYYGMASFSFTVKGNDNTTYTTSISLAVVPNNSKPLPVVSITAPMSGKMYLTPASVVLSATASVTGGTIASVSFYNGTTLIATVTTSPYNYTWNNVPVGTYSITAVATDNSGQKSTSMAVSVTVTAPVVSIYQNASTDVWTNTANWTPAIVPAAAIDTAIIRTGEVKISQNFNGTVKVEPNGIFRMIGFYNIGSVELKGGTIKVNTSNDTYGMNAPVIVSSASTILAGANILSVFNLLGNISGSANLTKTGEGVVIVNSNAANFKGQWLVAQDTLTIASANGLGQCGAIVDTAVLDIDVATTTYSLSIKKGGKLNLDSNLTVQVAVFDNLNLPAGTYSKTTHPEFISGNGNLIVAKSLVISSAPASGSITLTANSGTSYVWSNGTTNISTTSAYTPTISGNYTVKVTNTNGCVITSAPLSFQAISLKKGWNLISTNIHPSDSTIATLFNSIDVQEIKTMDAFWRKGQNVIFNSLQKITTDNGYLVNMNAAGTLAVVGTPNLTGFKNLSGLSSGWQLIGCPYQTATPFTIDFNANNCSKIKNFDGFWIPNGTTNSLQNLEPGKGYFIKK